MADTNVNDSASVLTSCALPSSVCNASPSSTSSPPPLLVAPTPAYAIYDGGDPLSQILYSVEQLASSNGHIEGAAGAAGAPPEDGVKLKLFDSPGLSMTSATPPKLISSNSPPVAVAIDTAADDGIQD